MNIGKNIGFDKLGKYQVYLSRGSATSHAVSQEVTIFFTNQLSPLLFIVIYQVELEPPVLFLFWMEPCQGICIWNQDFVLLGIGDSFPSRPLHVVCFSSSVCLVFYCCCVRSFVGRVGQIFLRSLVGRC